MMWLWLLPLVLLGMRVEGDGESNDRALSMFKSSYHGHATYYGARKGSGACQFGDKNPPLASRVDMLAALNKGQLMSRIMCGSCWHVHAPGVGKGTDPVEGNFTVLIDNECPACGQGSLDLGKEGGGRWDIDIQAVQCPVGDLKLEYLIRGNNHYRKVCVRNSRLPVHLMEVDYNESGWRKAPKTPDGCFNVRTSKKYGPFGDDYSLRLTAINGAQITQDFTGFTNGKIVTSDQQFPLDENLP